MIPNMIQLLNTLFKNQLLVTNHSQFMYSIICSQWCEFLLPTSVKMWILFRELTVGHYYNSIPLYEMMWTAGIQMKWVCDHRSESQFKQLRK